jgi:SAM-dependent methyltransferase
MDSRELGLVLGQQLLGIEDLHYGLWDPDLKPTLGNLPVAQQRYTDFLLNTLPAPDKGAVRVLDIGCGTGHLMKQMIERGYRVDGVSPSPSLSRKVRERLSALPEADTTLFECRFEDFPWEEHRERYDAAVFSESFQYIPMERAFEILATIVKPGGTVVICDFFQTDATGDGGPGDGSFGGGHPLRDFQSLLQRIPFKVERDEDITKRVSPNLALLDDLLMNKLGPAFESIGRYFEGRRPLLFGTFRRMFRKRLDKIRFKYFSGYRNDRTFERYKSYHLVMLSRPAR